MNLRPQGCAAVRDCMDFLEVPGENGNRDTTGAESSFMPGWVAWRD
jgi:hypothetical protein